MNTKPGLSFDYTPVPLKDTLLYLIEQYYWDNGHIPSPEYLAQKSGEPNVQTVKKELKKLTNVLANRGIIDQDTQAGLTVQQQVVAIAMLTVERKNEAKKLMDLNELFEKQGMPAVSPQKWAAWKRMPAMQAYLSSRAKQQFDADEYKFYQSVQKGIEDGDLGFTKLYGEIQGIYNPRLQVDINVGAVIAQLFEIMSRHVAPEVLETIGMEIEKELNAPG